MRRNLVRLWSLSIIGDERTEVSNERQLRLHSQRFFQFGVFKHVTMTDDTIKLLWPRGLVRRMHQRRQSQELLTQVSWVRIPVAACHFFLK